MNKQANSADIKKLEELIKQAVKKVNGSKENDLCKYLPSSKGGYIHHFTLRKMKRESPLEICEMVSKYVITADNPKIIAPRRRAPRGSRKRPDFITFTRGDLEHMLTLARSAGDEKMIQKLSPRKSFPSLKRELIRSIREGRISQELWNSYCDAVNLQNSGLSLKSSEKTSAANEAVQAIAR